MLDNQIPAWALLQQSGEVESRFCSNIFSSTEARVEDSLSSSATLWLQQNCGILEAQFSPVALVKRWSYCGCALVLVTSRFMWSTYNIEWVGMTFEKPHIDVLTPKVTSEFLCQSWSEAKAVHDRTPGVCLHCSLLPPLQNSHSKSHSNKDVKHLIVLPRMHKKVLNGLNYWMVVTNMWVVMLYFV